MLVLDEPTAHLDPETAEVLIDDVLDAAGDRSVLLITHRPEGLDLVDEVVELEPASRPSLTPELASAAVLGVVAASSRSSSSRFGNRKNTRRAPSRTATIPAV